MPVILALLLLSTPAWGHSFSPMRLEAASGTKTTVSQFTIRNQFRDQTRFSITCYRVQPGGDLHVECVAVPGMVILSPNGQRKVKVKLDTPEDGLYRICSTEEPNEDENKPLVTRICATIGVGADPNVQPSVSPKRRAAANDVAARARQNQIK